jgi:hypothetical protein
MKSNFWLFGGMASLAAASVLAQATATAPARGSNAPAVSRLVTGPLAKDVVLDTPAAATVRIDTLLVRSQPAFAGEVITSVKKGQAVSVLEQLTIAKPKPGEPTNWARIILPPAAAVWVFADYVDTNTMTISRPRVNVRSGSSDFHDVVGRLDKGTPVKEVRRVPDWMQIEPTTNVYGFVGADYLTISAPPAPPPAPAVVADAAPAPAAAAPVAGEPSLPPLAVAAPGGSGDSPDKPGNLPGAPSPAAAAPAAPEPAAPPATNVTAETSSAPAAAAPAPPEPAVPPATNVTSDTAVTAAATPPAAGIVAPEPTATAPTPAPETPAAPAAVAPEAPAAAVVPAPAPARAVAPIAAAPDSNVPPRIVTREGYVHKALNIQAPADYELRDLNSKELIEYLQPDPKDKIFPKYTGARISVTGTEWLDRRWPRTPILRIQTVDLMP